ncbi:hypothetical protein B0H34DRAFT_509531 [Crassisporium funariophilum]|nr:hypothetical protein B0H34DRAFT_509531 [Crassisporium funariophilum]
MTVVSTSAILASLNPLPILQLQSWAMPSSGLNISFLLVGSYVNLVLYTVELVAAYVYFSSERSKRDRRLLKGTLAFDVLLDALGTFSACAVNLLFIVNFWGKTDEINKTSWPFVIWRVTNALGAFIFQGFMLFRYWSFRSKNRIVFLVTFALMLATLASGLRVAAETVINGPLSARQGYFQQFIVALAGGLLTDIAIAAALIWELRKRSAFYTQTKNLISRISSLAIKTSSVTCIFALATLVAYLAYPQSRLSTSFGFFLPRVYTLTILFTLIYRDNLVTDPGIRDDGSMQLGFLSSYSAAAVQAPATALSKFTTLAFPRDKLPRTLPGPRGDSLAIRTPNNPGLGIEQSSSAIQSSSLTTSSKQYLDPMQK